MIKVIAIDGPSGVGKSTLARSLAAALRWQYLDTGGLYRCITWAWLKDGDTPELLSDQAWLDGIFIDVEGANFRLNGDDISREIRSQEVTQNVSTVSSVATIRNHLTAMMRRFAIKKPCVLDGRDIGTVVFPNAFLKIYLTASPEARARRRWLELGGEQSPVPYQQVLVEQQARDSKDMTREVAPLIPADDAWKLDTDELDAKGVLEEALHEAHRRLASLEHL
ncbi:MAG: (d)CMP kinase [Acidobacteria bacterium]|nr:(d)CMP kinase [Acidobacteriota bacterium]